VFKAAKMRDLSHNDRQSKSGMLVVNSGLLALILITGLVYVFSINAMGTQTFQIKKLSGQIDELETQHKKLELQNSTLQSVNTLEQQTARLNFVPATNVTYLKDDNFALK
jgi:cell division protein FtsB